MPALRQADADLRHRAAASGSPTSSSCRCSARSRSIRAVMRGRRHAARRSSSPSPTSSAAQGARALAERVTTVAERLTAAASRALTDRPCSTRPPDSIRRPRCRSSRTTGCARSRVDRRVARGDISSPTRCRATIARVALPAVASSLLMTLFSSVDAFWVGTRIGAAGLAAVSTSLFWIWMIISLAEMVSVGLTAVAARRHGEGRPSEAARDRRRRAASSRSCSASLVARSALRAAARRVRHHAHAARGHGARARVSRRRICSARR